MKEKLIPVVILAVLLSAGFLFFSNYTNIKASANTNIDSVDRFAWDDLSGWWDFHSTDTVVVRGTKIDGYATSTEGFGYMSLDCATSPSGNICETSTYGICNGPGPKQSDGTCPNANALGILTGYAWNDQIGWISFNCVNHDGCDTSNYKVEIDADGNFFGYAWNDVSGWISFNCANHGGCSESNYKVVTEWRSEPITGYLESAVFDTVAEGGVVLNSITWHGELPSGTSVDFQVAVSDSSEGPWNFEGPTDNSDYYGAPCATGIKGGVGDAPSGEPICVNPEKTKDKRYLRYRVRMQSNLLQDETPRIDDVILNWSR